jgi:D-alanyl-D-alanine carboxypeptidase/D-alanyl-D-alanine-endopeptidase (penicillin-binding protein 4)
MSRQFHLWIQAIIIVLGVLAVSARADLDTELDRLISKVQWGSARVGAVIADPETGEILAEYRADDQFTPASNMKLLTSGAALDHLGPDYVFETTLRLVDDVLVLDGCGDPALGDPELLDEHGVGIEELLQFWVDAVVDAGVTTIDRVVIDATTFDRQWVHPSWSISELNKRYSAEVAGLNFHLNVITCFPRPTTPGQAPLLTFEPEAPWLEISPGGKTVSKGRNTVWFSRKYMTNEIKMHGNVRSAMTAGVQVTVHDVPDFVSRLFVDRLRRAGIDIQGALVATVPEDVPEGGRAIAVVRNEIGAVLTRCNTDSQNLYAESLMKRIGHELTGEAGSWATGAAAMRYSILDRIGPAGAKAIVIDDGSGLSPENRVTPRLLAEWLVSFARDPQSGPVLMQSLAVGGESGTLARRFREGDDMHGTVRAKSGYISGVSCLSGYVEGPEGDLLAFALMVNDIGGKLTVGDAKRWQEEVVRAIDDELARQYAAAHPDESAVLSATGD